MYRIRNHLADNNYEKTTQKDAFYVVEIRKKFLWWSWWEGIKVPYLVIKRWGIKVSQYDTMIACGDINKCKNMFHYLRKYNDITHWHRGYKIYAILNDTLDGVVYYCDKFDRHKEDKVSVYETLQEWYKEIDAIKHDEALIKKEAEERGYEYTLKKLNMK